MEAFSLFLFLMKETNFYQIFNLFFFFKKLESFDLKKKN